MFSRVLSQIFMINLLKKSLLIDLGNVVVNVNVSVDVNVNVSVDMLLLIILLFDDNVVIVINC